MKPYKNKQGFSGITLLIIVVVILVGTGIYLNTRSKTEVVSTQGSDVKNTLPTPTGGTKVTVTPTPMLAGWKTQTSTQYGYKIDYPSTATLASLKISPVITVEDNTKTAACKTNEGMSNTSISTFSSVQFYVNPLQANGGSFITVYTAVRNSLCYQIIFRIGDRNSRIDSLETKNAVGMVNQIMSTLRFTK